METFILPPGFRLSMSCFVISDSAGQSMEVTASGGTSFTGDPDAFRSLSSAACGMLNAASDVSDARPMTNDEIRDYRAAMEDQSNQDEGDDE